jgi:hypothetical protein
MSTGWFLKYAGRFFPIQLVKNREAAFLPLPIIYAIVPGNFSAKIVE